MKAPLSLSLSMNCRPLFPQDMESCVLRSRFSRILTFFNFCLIAEGLYFQQINHNNYYQGLDGKRKGHQLQEKFPHFLGCFWTLQAQNQVLDCVHLDIEMVLSVKVQFSASTEVLYFHIFVSCHKGQPGSFEQCDSVVTGHCPVDRTEPGNSFA